MSSQQRAGRRFQIERLEERIVPDCLFWQGALLDGVVPLGAALGTSRSSSRHAVSIGRIATLRASLAQPNSAQVAAAAAEPRSLPAWAEVFLVQIERDFEQRALASASPATAAADVTSRLDALLATVDQRLSEAVNSDGQAARAEGTMPLWAEDLLLEIRQELTLPAALSRSRIVRGA
ncbi:MAG: hypothetical protein HY290_32370 [Planctomycetia bacterium]|nr:hypothetical protein [Planctomycetia bacterium]